MNQSVAGRRAIFLRTCFWLKRLLANLAFFGLQGSRHSGNRSANVDSALIAYITTLLTASNVALSPRLKHFTAFNTWPWLNNYGSFVVLVIATSAAKPLITASGQKQIAATLTSNLLLYWSHLVAVSGSVLLLQLVSAFVRTSLVAARLSIKPL